MGNKSSALPYDVGERVCSLGGGWVLHDGRKKKSNEPVSVLKFDKKSAGTREKELAENFFKRAKTLRHPHVIAYRDGIDSDAEIFIVTDAVETLECWLERFGEQDGAAEKRKMAVGWGFNAILQALGFLNEDCKLCHGNISLQSILVTRGGDWKLAGFYIVGEMDPTGPDRLFRENPDILPSKYKPPERLANKWSFMNTSSGGPHTVDVFALGCVLFECFNGPVNDPNEFKNTRALPSQLQKVYNLMIADTPSDRPDCKSLLRHPSFKYLFRSELFSTLSFLEELQLKTDAERAPFIQKLAEVTPRLPKETNWFKILPALANAFRYTTPGGAGIAPVPGAANSSSSALRLSPLSSMLLVPYLQIASSMDDKDELRRMVVPTLLDLFASQDRGLRAALLQNLAKFVEYIDPKTINDQLFPQVCTGFRDAAPMLRELTIRFMVSLAPHLAPKTLNETLLRHLVQSLQDKEPAIRTNTLICLNKLLGQFNEETRKKIILSSFPQVVRDPFVPARLAGLRGLKAGLVYLEGDAPSLAGKVIPPLAYALIDPAPEVRELGFQIVDKCVGDLRTISVKRAEDQRREAEEAKKRDLDTRQGNQIGPNASASAVGRWLGGFAFTDMDIEFDGQRKGLSLKSSKLAAPALDDGGEGWGDDDDDVDDDDNATSGGGWGDDDDDDDDLLAVTEAPSFKSQGSASKLVLPGSSDDFFAESTGANKVPRAPSTASARKLGLSAPKPRGRTPSPSLSEASNTSQDRARKREEARQRIAQRREKAKAKAVARPVAKSGDGNDDDWDNW
ncbi:N-terminal kinase-like protein [Hondaea fermentalgiana]|uniref:N-terminal kinase-like protein n=1 Tax=Hondaea fermentalgiana TaxID=2315210 RepID=A0A2R5G1I0_9STRA|nr:N-terminal kinase-like protein [Hondaea fermentalgiana]|eukprot:GBG24886.1 N-terminal kinase-like protein [Hondaea fermentalgiana]